jgi:hypothetical protein
MWKLSPNLENKKTIKIYIIQNWTPKKHWGLNLPHLTVHNWYRRFTPNCSGRWKNLELCDDFDKAELYVAMRSPRRVNPLIKKCPPRSVINFQREPKAHLPPPSQIGPETIASRWVTESHNPGIWWSRKTYSELADNPFPEKTRLASYVTTGRYGGAGQRNRIDFTRSFTELYPNILDVYGNNVGGFDLTQIAGYRGFLEDKWNGLAPYRYSFAFENTYERNYFSEKLNDVILAGCVPIYWGCTNIDDFFPKGSIVKLDITKFDAVDRAMKIIKSDYRERHLAELERAKDLILNRYQFWPTVHRVINELMEQGELMLG